MERSDRLSLAPDAGGEADFGEGAALRDPAGVLVSAAADEAAVASGEYGPQPTAFVARTLN